MSDVAALLAARESESVERKESWGDDCLKALAALANTRGGALLVGVTDGGRVIGWQGDGKEQERIYNQIVATLRVHPLTMMVDAHAGQTMLSTRAEKLRRFRVFDLNHPHPSEWPAARRPMDAKG